MTKLSYFVLSITSMLLISWTFGGTLVRNNPDNTAQDTLSSFIYDEIDSIAIRHSMKLPFGSTPALQIYNDSLLISSFNTESYTNYDREANEFFDINEKFFDTDIFLTDKNQAEKRLFSKTLKSNGNESHPAISADGKLLVFTVTRNLKSQPNLYYSMYANSEWQPKKRLIFEGYEGNVYASFPYLNMRNDLYFSSGKNSDSLNLDIYRAAKQINNWSLPQALDNGINTAYNEISPVEVGDSLLFFASDRPGGYGGYDLYVARLQDSVYSVANLGAPFNTPLDELYLLADNMDITRGYIVRYTETEKITPDLFSYKIFLKEHEPLLAFDTGHEFPDSAASDLDLPDAPYADKLLMEEQDSLFVINDTNMSRPYLSELVLMQENQAAIAVGLTSDSSGSGNVIKEKLKEYPSYQTIRINIELLESARKNNAEANDQSILLSSELIEIPAVGLANISVLVSD